MVVVPVTLWVTVAVMLDVILGVVVIVVDAGFSRHVHIAPTADEAKAFTLLSCETLGSTARAVTSERFSFAAAGVTVTVVVASAVAVFLAHARSKTCGSHTIVGTLSAVYPASE